MLLDRATTRLSWPGIGGVLDAAARPHRAVQYHPGRGRIFQTAWGGILQDSAYGEVWTEARKQALTSAQCPSPLGRRPYDLRHAAVSLWLNSGVPATEVARRARHGVVVLIKIYALHRRAG
jgi:integrase